MLDIIDSVFKLKDKENKNKQRSQLKHLRNWAKILRRFYFLKSSVCYIILLAVVLFRKICIVKGTNRHAEVLGTHTRTEKNDVILSRVSEATHRILINKRNKRIVSKSTEAYKKPINILYVFQLSFSQ